MWRGGKAAIKEDSSVWVDDALDFAAISNDGLISCNNALMEAQQIDAGCRL